MTSNFHALTEQQKTIVSNGCGPRRFFTVKGHPFEEVCDEHDFDYYLGCTWADKRGSDRRFFHRLRLRAMNRPLRWDRVKFRTLARVFYIAVFFFGHISFYYADRQRTILEIMEAAKK